ncbi:MAG: hypothetical protein QMD71_05155 [bacterium]|nr:hypothetical protein [bacterium]
MINRILFILSDKEYPTSALEFLVNFSKNWNARVILFAPIDPNLVSSISQNEGRKRREVREEITSKAWMSLYSLEDVFKSQSIYTRLIVDDVTIPEGVIERIQRIKPSFIVTGADFGSSLIKSMGVKLSVPVLLLPER